MEKAVYAQNHKLLYDLKNWIREDIDRAIDRLKDEKFIWAKNIEKYLPKELERKEQVFVVVKMGRKHWKLN